MSEKWKSCNDPSTSLNNFFNYIEDYLVERNMTQSKFCETYKISYRWFNNNMRDRPTNMGLKVLCSIATKMDVDFIEMITYSGKSQKKI